MENTLIYISKKYVYKQKYLEVLNQFKNMFKYLISYYEITVLNDLKQNNINVELINKKYMFDILREEVKYVIVFYDLEDMHAADIITYCALHTIPIMIINNPLDDLDV